MIDYRFNNWCTKCGKPVPKEILCPHCNTRTRWGARYVKKERKPLLIVKRVD